MSSSLSLGPTFSSLELVDQNGVLTPPIHIGTLAGANAPAPSNTPAAALPTASNAFVTRSSCQRKEFDTLPKEEMRVLHGLYEIMNGLLHDVAKIKKATELELGQLKKHIIELEGDVKDLKREQRIEQMTCDRARAIKPAGKEKKATLIEAKREKEEAVAEAGA
ncbi:hypothetical protein CRG98_034315 [Punica granatum]|uniref:Uncharacterized protein n=1 Tax=Punica granatum TaxID=22663 RepID=A0A2I0IPC5_PUNGR|nr:hypothetical protein CRG98_034315 [Punica granatum]